jgi:hypothetical protein
VLAELTAAETSREAYREALREATHRLHDQERRVLAAERRAAEYRTVTRERQAA